MVMALPLARGGGFVLFGFNWWSALLSALLLVCPVLILWGLHITRPAADEPAVHTHGMTMNPAGLFSGSGF